jgi:hypothetical protein
LLTSTEGIPRRGQCPDSVSLAGFQTSLIGRFWVTPEGHISAIRFLLKNDRIAHGVLPLTLILPANAPAWLFGGAGWPPARRLATAAAARFREAQ